MKTCYIQKTARIGKSSVCIHQDNRQSLLIESFKLSKLQLHRLSLGLRQSSALPSKKQTDWVFQPRRIRIRSASNLEHWVIVCRFCQYLRSQRQAECCRVLSPQCVVHRSTVANCRGVGHNEDEYIPFAINLYTSSLNIIYRCVASPCSRL